MSRDTTFTNSHGDVDADGEIVDRVHLDERLRSAIGEHRATDVSADSQLSLARTLLLQGLARTLLLRAREVAT